MMFIVTRHTHTLGSTHSHTLHMNESWGQGFLLLLANSLKAVREINKVASGLQLQIQIVTLIHQLPAPNSRLLALFTHLAMHDFRTQTAA